MVLAAAAFHIKNHMKLPSYRTLAFFLIHFLHDPVTVSSPRKTRHWIFYLTFALVCTELIVIIVIYEDTFFANGTDGLPFKQESALQQKRSAEMQLNI